VMSWGNGEHVVVGVVALGCADVSAVARNHHFGDEEVETVERGGVGLGPIVDGWVECAGYVGYDGRVSSGEIDFHVCF